MLLLLSNVLNANNTVGWVIYGIFCLFFVFMVSLLVVKRLIPAIKGDIALQLDEEGINDYIRDVSIGWADIDDIRLIRGRSASLLRISLKFESDYGSAITIPLRWVKGKDDDIYDAVLNYFEFSNTIE